MTFISGKRILNVAYALLSIYGIVISSTFFGIKLFSESNLREYLIFSPVLVDLLSIIILSLGIPIFNATSANVSASDFVQFLFESLPNPPENTIKGAKSFKNN